MESEKRMNLRSMHIGQKIRKLRELKNLTQSHMAQQLGLTQSSYSKLELGESEVPYSRLERIADVMGLKPEDIVSFNEQMVFNIMNNPNGGNVFSNVYQKALTDNERKLYDEQIFNLKEEIIYLKSIIEKLLGKSMNSNPG
jgi:transcriptional regulator with XRE-family HTH domain